MVQLTEIELTFTLPEWVTNKKFWWTERIYYGESHIWAGQVKEDKPRNYIFDRLFNMEGSSQFCDHPWGPWVSFKVENATPPAIQNVKTRLNNLLREFKNAK